MADSAKAPAPPKEKDEGTLPSGPEAPPSYKNDEQLTQCFCRVRDHFCKQPIYRTQRGLLVAHFGVTDFIQPLSPQIVEDMARCMIALCPFFRADIIVSIADRSGGSLTHSISKLSGLPYTLANWYPIGSPGEVLIEKCAGFSGNGLIDLNGLRKNMNVIVVGDVLKSGTTAKNLIQGTIAAGCNVICAAFGCEILESGARENLLSDIAVHSLVKIHVRAECTKEAGSNVLPPTIPCGSFTHLPPKAIAAIKKMPREVIQQKLDRVSLTFLNIAIHRNPKLAYPYSFFTLTDFVPPLIPDLVEDMADLCVYYGDFERCDVIVSEADRGGGPLAQAVAVRVHKPYVLANWYPSGENVGASTFVQVGFSGEGSIVVNGIRTEDRCTFVDDMLSSGGTAEGVLRSIVQLGGIPMEAVFISEKLYPPKKAGGLPLRKGKDRLMTVFPYLVCTTVAQFVADGERTKAPSMRIGD